MFILVVLGDRIVIFNWVGFFSVLFRYVLKDKFIEDGVVWNVGVIIIRLVFI